MKVTAMSEGQQLRRVINSFQSFTVSLNYVTVLYSQILFFTKGGGVRTP